VSRRALIPNNSLVSIVVKEAAHQATCFLVLSIFGGSDEGTSGIEVERSESVFLT
jgi:hypothetical protein